MPATPTAIYVLSLWATARSAILYDDWTTAGYFFVLGILVHHDERLHHFPFQRRRKEPSL